MSQALFQLRSDYDVKSIPELREMSICERAESFINNVQNRPDLYCRTIKQAVNRTTSFLESPKYYLYEHEPNMYGEFMEYCPHVMGTWEDQIINNK